MLGIFNMEGLEVRGDPHVRFGECEACSPHVARMAFQSSLSHFQRMYQVVANSIECTTWTVADEEKNKTINTRRSDPESTRKMLFYPTFFPRIIHKVGPLWP